MPKGDAMIDFGSYSKNFKGIDEPHVENIKGVPVLRVKTKDEVHLYNWDKVTSVTFKSTEGND